MKIQQRRLFFLATATSNAKRKEGGPAWKLGFRPWGRIAAILSAALLISCSSLTPDRVNVLAQIAGQAAQVGAAEWLAKHPEHRDAFNLVIAELSALHKNGNTNEQTLEYAFVERMASLPTDTLRGPDGELYLTGGSTNAVLSPNGGLVVFDRRLNKSMAVRGAATGPVLQSTLLGLRRALLPKPPMPPTTKLVLPSGVVARELEGRASEGDGRMSGRSDLVFATSGNVALGILGTLTPTNQLHVTGTPPGPTRVSGLSVASTFDVSLNEHGIQQVNVRWAEAQGIYVVERSESAINLAWEGWVSVTNAGVWTTPWPAQVPVGYWRVVRR